MVLDARSVGLGSRLLRLLRSRMDLMRKTKIKKEHKKSTPDNARNLKKTALVQAHCDASGSEYGVGAR